MWFLVAGLIWLCLVVMVVRLFAANRAHTLRMDLKRERALRELRKHRLRRKVKKGGTA